jgi:pilus assembly protein Flp/PilA
MEEAVQNLIAKFVKDESGASLIEYVLIGGLISIVGIVTMGVIGTNIQTIWTNISTGVADAATP